MNICVVIRPIFCFSELAKAEGLIHFKVANFSAFSRCKRRDQQLFSEPILIRGVRWRLVVQCIEQSRTKQLGISVQCDDDIGLCGKNGWKKVQKKTRTKPYNSVQV